MRKSFNFYASYFEIANEMNDIDRLCFYDALIMYQLTGNKTKLEMLTGMAKFAYVSQKHSIETQVKGHIDKSNSLENKPFTGYLNTEKISPILTPKQGGIEAPTQGGAIPPEAQLQVQCTSKSTTTSKKKSKNTIYYEEIQNLLLVFNECFKSNYTSVNTLIDNYSFWRETYKPDQIEQAIINVSKDRYWSDKMTPIILFRQKNANKENVDYIGQFLNSKQNIIQIDVNAKIQSDQNKIGYGKTWIEMSFDEKKKNKSIATSEQLIKFNNEEDNDFI